MANYSDLTRKEQVLTRLQQAGGSWVDGPEISNEEVGGSEGLRRLRELADEGWDVRKRHHPDPDRDIWQYRLAGKKREVGQVTSAPEPAEKPEYPRRADPAPPRPPEPRPSAWPADHQQTPIHEAVRRKEDGTYEYVPPQRPIIEGQLSLGPEPTETGDSKFDRLPKRVDYGSVTICPRCHMKGTRGRPPKAPPTTEELARMTVKERRAYERRKKEGNALVDDDGVLLWRDPYTTKAQPCTRCNGYGIVPNVGPVA